MREYIPKYVKDYLRNSIIPISTLQINIAGIGFGIASNIAQ